jgi:regulator of nucleoside diphosphate kinase
MGAILTGNILITEQDKQKLERLLTSPVGVFVEDMRYATPLTEELERARVVGPDDTPADLVTMNSTVRVRDLDTEQESVYTLSYPHQADVARGRISVLAPIGTALLGYREGDIVEWQVPARLKRLQIVEVIFQPDSDGRQP